MSEYVLLELMGNRISWYENHERYYMNERGNELNKTGLSANILSIINGESFDDLDWKNTDLDKPDSEYGWLDRDGSFYGCGHEDHDRYARFILKETVGALERAGWIRVAMGWLLMGIQYHGRITAEQRNTLSQMGYTEKDWGDLT